MNRPHIIFINFYCSIIYTIVKIVYLFKGLLCKRKFIYFFQFQKEIILIDLINFKTMILLIIVSG